MAALVVTSPRRGGVLRQTLLASVLSALAFGGTASARKPPTPCPDGPFLVAQARHPGAATQPGSDLIIVSEGVVDIAGHCPAVAVKRRARRRETFLKAVWRPGQCAEFTGPVRFAAHVAAPACSTLRGVLRVRKPKPRTRSFVATRLNLSSPIVTGDQLPLGIEPLPASDPQHPNKSGDRDGPMSLTVMSDGVLVLDPRNQRILRVRSSTQVEAFDTAPFYAGAFDLLATADGSLYAVGSATCHCVRQITAAGATGVDLPVASTLFPGLLAGDATLLTLDGPDGPHVLMRNGTPLSLDQQHMQALPGVWHAGLDAAIAAIIPDATDTHTVTVHGTTPAGTTAFDLDVDVLGTPSSVELVAPACNDSILLVTSVITSTGLAQSMVRLDTSGKVLARGLEPMPTNPGTAPQPYRTLAASPSGALFELRVSGDGYAIIAWSTGC